MKPDHNEYQVKSGQIRQLASLPPDELVNHLTKAHSSIDQVAPNITPHIFAGANNAIQFLNSKLPNQGNELMQDKIHEPAQSIKNRWLELHDVVNDPVSVLNHVHEGTINSHHLEALQAVYPDLHEEMKSKIMDELGAMKMKGQTVPYAKRLAISKFIGQPLDSTMTQPMRATIMMANSQNTTPQTGQNQRKASGADLSQINKVNDLYKTPLQKIQSER